MPLGICSNSMIPKPLKRLGSTNFAPFGAVPFLADQVIGWRMEKGSGDVQRCSMSLALQGALLF